MIMSPDPRPTLAQLATLAGEHATIETDPLDRSLWLHCVSPAAAEQTVAALHAHGLAAAATSPDRIHVTGWDARLLRYRLGVLLAGVDDLREEWDATAEMVRYHYDRRAAHSAVEPEPWEVLGDVDAVMRRCEPLPHHAPNVGDVATLLALVAAAGKAYQQLITEHLDYAERVLADYSTVAGGWSGRQHRVGPIPGGSALRLLPRQRLVRHAVSGRQESRSVPACLSCRG
jgi:hypothetical protein